MRQTSQQDQHEMPEVFYFRGSRPTLPEPNNPEMLVDLKAIAAIGDDQVDALELQLSRATGFLDPKRLVLVARRALGDDDAAGSVQRVLRNLRLSHVDRLLRLISELDPPPLTARELERLRDFLPRLLAEYPPLTRFRKAERLSRSTGQPLEGLELICDLRPIFDESRERMEGMMPYTRLVVTATGSDGLPKTLEAELSYSQVSDLMEAASKARQKLDVLRKFVEASLPDGLPNLPLTRARKKEQSDG